MGERPGKPIAVTPVCAQDMGTSQDARGVPQPRKGEADWGFLKGLTLDLSLEGWQGAGLAENGVHGVSRERISTCKVVQT